MGMVHLRIPLYVPTNIPLGDLQDSYGYLEYLPFCLFVPSSGHELFSFSFPEHELLPCFPIMTIRLFQYCGGIKSTGHYRSGHSNNETIIDTAPWFSLPNHHLVLIWSHAFTLHTAMCISHFSLIHKYTLEFILKIRSLIVK